jgi:hypothetical protein
MSTVLIPIARELVRPYGPLRRSPYAPLRRSLPAAPVLGRHDVWRTALLAAVGVAVFVDVEFALAYVLYFAARAFN